MITKTLKVYSLRMIKLGNPFVLYNFSITMIKPTNTFTMEM